MLPPELEYLTPVAGGLKRFLGIAQLFAEYVDGVAGGLHLALAVFPSDVDLDAAAISLEFALRCGKGRAVERADAGAAVFGRGRGDAQEVAGEEVQRPGGPGVAFGASGF